MHVQKTLKLLVLSGEVLSISLWNILRGLLPDTIILNLYGSTEVRYLFSRRVGFLNQVGGLSFFLGSRRLCIVLASFRNIILPIALYFNVLRFNFSLFIVSVLFLMKFTFWVACLKIIC